MKNFTLIFALLLTSLFYSTDISACAWNEVTISPTGTPENPLCPGSGITITICKPGCRPVAENLAAGGSMGIDITNPNGAVSNLNFSIANLIPGTNDCVSLEYRLPGFGGEYTFNNMSYTNASGTTTGQVIGETTIYNNGSTVFVASSSNNDFNLTTQGNNILTSGGGNGLEHEWTLNGELTDCNSALCAFGTETPGNYEICHTILNQGDCGSETVCQSIFMIDLGGCGAPNGGGMGMYMNCAGKVSLQTAEYTGISHQFRYRVQGQDSWSVTTVTDAFNISIGQQRECTTIEVQIRIGCQDDFSDWSSSKVFTTRADVPTLSSVSADPSSDFAYLYCQDYPGDSKQFRYKKQGASFQYVSTTSHYVTALNLTSNTLFVYQVRRKCGRTGQWSCFTPLQEFKTPAKYVGDGIGRIAQEEDVLIIEKTAKIIAAPNPSTGRFSLSGDLVKVGNEMTIHNLIGTKVIAKTIDDDINIEFNLNLQAGIYFLTIVDKLTGKMTSERIIIQNL